MNLSEPEDGYARLSLRHLWDTPVFRHPAPRNSDAVLALEIPMGDLGGSTFRDLLYPSNVLLSVFLAMSISAWDALVKENNPKYKTAKCFPFALEQDPPQGPFPMRFFVEVVNRRKRVRTLAASSDLEDELEAMRLSTHRDSSGDMDSDEAFLVAQEEENEAAVGEDQPERSPDHAIAIRVFCVVPMDMAPLMLETVSLALMLGKEARQRSSAGFQMRARHPMDKPVRLPKDKFYYKPAYIPLNQEERARAMRNEFVVRKIGMDTTPMRMPPSDVAMKSGLLAFSSDDVYRAVGDYLGGLNVRRSATLDHDVCLGGSLDFVSILRIENCHSRAAARDARGTGVRVVNDKQDLSHDSLSRMYGRELQAERGHELHEVDKRDHGKFFPYDTLVQELHQDTVEDLLNRALPTVPLRLTPAQIREGFRQFELQCGRIQNMEGEVAVAPHMGELLRSQEDYREVTCTRYTEMLARQGRLDRQGPKPGTRTTLITQAAEMVREDREAATRHGPPPGVGLAQARMQVWMRSVQQGAVLLEQVFGTSVDGAAPPLQRGARSYLQNNNVFDTSVTFPNLALPMSHAHVQEQMMLMSTVHGTTMHELDIYFQIVAGLSAFYRGQDEALGIPVLKTGPPSTGKSGGTRMCKRMWPQEMWMEVRSLSPKTLIYTQFEMVVLLFQEMPRKLLGIEDGPQKGEGTEMADYFKDMLESGDATVLSVGKVPRKDNPAHTEMKELKWKVLAELTFNGNMNQKLRSCDMAVLSRCVTKEVTQPGQRGTSRGTMGSGMNCPPEMFADMCQRSHEDVYMMCRLAMMQRAVSDTDTSVLDSAGMGSIQETLRSLGVPGFDDIRKPKRLTRLAFVHMLVRVITLSRWGPFREHIVARRPDACTLGFVRQLAQECGWQEHEDVDKFMQKLLRRGTKRSAGDGDQDESHLPHLFEEEEEREQGEEEKRHSRRRDQSNSLCGSDGASFSGASGDSSFDFERAATLMPAMFFTLDDLALSVGMSLREFIPETWKWVATMILDYLGDKRWMVSKRCHPPNPEDVDEFYDHHHNDAEAGFTNYNFLYLRFQPPSGEDGDEAANAGGDQFAAAAPQGERRQQRQRALDFFQVAKALKHTRSNQESFKRATWEIAQALKDMASVQIYDNKYVVPKAVDIMHDVVDEEAAEEANADEDEFGDQFKVTALPVVPQLVTAVGIHLNEFCVSKAFVECASQTIPHVLRKVLEHRHLDPFRMDSPFFGDAQMRLLLAFLLVADDRLREMARLSERRAQNELRRLQRNYNVSTALQDVESGTEEGRPKSKKHLAKERELLQTLDFLQECIGNAGMPCAFSLALGTSAVTRLTQQRMELLREEERRLYPERTEAVDVYQGLGGQGGVAFLTMAAALRGRSVRVDANTPATDRSRANEGDPMVWCHVRTHCVPQHEKTGGEETRGTFWASVLTKACKLMCREVSVDSEEGPLHLSLDDSRLDKSPVSKMAKSRYLSTLEERRTAERMVSVLLARADLRPDPVEERHILETGAAAPPGQLQRRELSQVLEEQAGEEETNKPWDEQKMPALCLSLAFIRHMFLRARIVGTGTSVEGQDNVLQSVMLLPKKRACRVKFRSRNPWVFSRARDVRSDEGSSFSVSSVGTEGGMEVDEPPRIFRACGGGGPSSVAPSGSGGEKDGGAWLGTDPNTQYIMNSDFDVLSAAVHAEKMGMSVNDPTFQFLLPKKLEGIRHAVEMERIRVLRKAVGKRDGGRLFRSGVPAGFCPQSDFVEVHKDIVKPKLEAIPESESWPTRAGRAATAESITDGMRRAQHLGEASEVSVEDHATLYMAGDPERRRQEEERRRAALEFLEDDTCAKRMMAELPADIASGLPVHERRKVARTRDGIMASVAKGPVERNMDSVHWAVNQDLVGSKASTGGIQAISDSQVVCLPC